MRTKSGATDDPEQLVPDEGDASTDEVFKEAAESVKKRAETKKKTDKKA